MAGEAYFRLNTNDNFESIKEDFIEIYNNDPFNIKKSIKWHNIIADGVNVSKKHPETYFMIEKQTDDCNLFENPFSRYHFINGQFNIEIPEIVWE